MENYQGFTPPREEILVYSDDNYNFRVYIADIEDDPNYYNPLFELLGNLGSNACVTFLINSYGGSLDIAIAIRNAIVNTEAETVAIIMSTAHSAGSIIALSCSELFADEGSYMLIHNGSNGMGGKSSDLEKQMEFTKPHYRNLTQAIYQDFLTDDEIQEMCKGDDKWFDSTQINERWKVVSQRRFEKFKEASREDAEEREAATVAKLIESGKYKIEKVSGS